MRSERSPELQLKLRDSNVKLEKRKPNFLGERFKIKQNMKMCFFVNKSYDWFEQGKVRSYGCNGSTVTNKCQVLEHKKAEHRMCKTRTDTTGPFLELIVQAQKVEFQHTTKKGLKSDFSSTNFTQKLKN